MMEKNQLTIAYEAIEMLRALDLPVSDEQLKALAALEKEYLQEEIVPLIKQIFQPFVEKLKGKYLFEVSYDNNEGLKLNLLDTEAASEEIATRERYTIDGGEPLRKRRFVLEVIKKYVANHPCITYDGLKRVFPDSLSRSPKYGVFRPYNTIVEKLQEQPDLQKRFFLDKEDLIKLPNGMLVTVFNQWGTNFPDFWEVAKRLYNVEVVNLN